VRVIRSFGDQATEDLFDGRNSKVARQSLPRSLWKIVARKLDALDQAEIMDDLGVPPGNRLEALRGDRHGQHSIRINDQYRICFRWSDSGPVDVEVVDYH
jgi:proteic killer suppression protein